MSSIVDYRAEPVYASFPNEPARLEHVHTAIRPTVNPATGHGPHRHDVSRPTYHAGCSNTDNREL